jgi:CheY-like chemotaxis protein
VDLRVLVADDYVDTADSTCALLERFGCTTAVASDGAAALALVDVFLPHVVILDIDMPILSGIDVALRIRANRSGHQPLLLIGMTGQSPGARQQALDAGFDEFVRKPVDSSWLVQGVKLWRSKADEAP